MVNTKYVASSILSTWDKSVNKTKILALMEISFRWTEIDHR